MSPWQKGGDINALASSSRYRTLCSKACQRLTDYDISRLITRKELKEVEKMIWDIIKIIVDPNKPGMIS